MDCLISRKIIRRKNSYKTFITKNNENKKLKFDIHLLFECLDRLHSNSLYSFLWEFGFHAYCIDKQLFYYIAEYYCLTSVTSKFFPTVLLKKNKQNRLNFLWYFTVYKELNSLFLHCCYYSRRVKTPRLLVMETDVLYLLFPQLPVNLGVSRQQR